MSGGSSNNGVEPTLSSVRCAPASGRGSRPNAALTSFAAWFGNALRAAEPGCCTCRGGLQAFGSPSPAQVSAPLDGGTYHMAYFIDLFSPETYEAFSRSSRDVSGFRLRHQRMAARVSPGDVFVCYLTRLSRWFGLLEVGQGPFIDDTPIFLPESDPFVVRFHVRPVVWLDVDKAVPIHDDRIWTGLSFTRGLEKGSIAWTGKVRGSLVHLLDRDGKFLAEQLTAQSVGGRLYPLDEQEVSQTQNTHRNPY